MGEVKKVQLKIADIEQIHIDKDYSFPDAYVMELPLDPIPDEVWHGLFRNEYNNDPYTLTRKIEVMRNSLRVITTLEECDKHLEWVRQLVDRTNNRVDEWNKARKQGQEAEMAKREQEKETIKKIRQKLLNKL
jgi:hypothetical protein